VLERCNIVGAMERRKRKRAETREGMVVTTVALSEEVHQRLAIAALEGRTVMTELVRQAVGEWLERRERKKPWRSKKS
jgi:hypothetical protein